MMKKLIVAVLMLFTLNGYAQETVKVDPFTKILVGPHVELVLKEGSEESVTLSNLHVDEEDIHVKVTGNTLKIYLEDARISTKHRKVYGNGYKMKEPVYRGTKVTATVSYQYLNKLSLRGEEYHQSLSTLNADKFRVKMYGEGELKMSSINAEKLKVKMYGDNEIEIKEGQIRKQKYKAYGENEIDSRNIPSLVVKSSNFGENKLRVNATSKVKFASMGETTIGYKGVSKVKKGIVLGEQEVYRID